MSEFVAKFESDFSLVFYLSTSTVAKSAWYLDSGASHHMTKVHELFSSLMKTDSGIHVKLGDDAKYAVKGEGTISFQLESGRSFDAQDVLFLPGLNKTCSQSQLWRTRVLPLSLGEGVYSYIQR